MLTRPQLAAILDAHAPFEAVPLAPSLRAWAARSELPVWQALEAAHGDRLGPPFYAVVWPGSQALAALILDGRIAVAGKRVADVGCGSGVTAVAAARMGAAHVLAVDLDPYAVAAAQELAQRHGVTVEGCVGNPLEDDHLLDGVEVILGGDVIYNAPTAALGKLTVALWQARGAKVFLADGGRPFFEAWDLLELAAFNVDVPHAVEGTGQRTVRVYGGR